MFKEDVVKGLQAHHKTLPSKYFYDEIGDKLFMQIMNAPEYYLTNAEFDIFQRKSKEIIQKLDLNSCFSLVELGAGDGVKTIEFLKNLMVEEMEFTYHPIDISGHVLKALEENLEVLGNELKTKPLEGDYFKMLNQLRTHKIPKVILFLGSNMGNMDDLQAAKFLNELDEVLNIGDQLILGLDLIKSKEIVLPAYNDQQGFTRAFNLNLLHRINKELGADFNTDQFMHTPYYDEKEGIAISYLQSKEDQEVFIAAANTSISFKKGEQIKTEISRKYNDSIVKGLIKGTGFQLIDKVLDDRSYFADFILKKVQ